MGVVKRLNNLTAASGNGGGDGIRYPGIWKLLLLWSVIGVLTAARGHLPYGPAGPDRDLLPGLLACTAWYFPWALLTPLVFRIEQRLPLGTPGWPLRLALLATISVPFCLLASPVMMGAFAVIRSAFSSTEPHRGHAFFWFGAFPTAEVLFWSSAVGGYFIRTVFQLHEQEQRAARLALEKSQLEVSLNQSQLEVLRARLNPHFLFNSLQNISVLTRQDPQTASRMLTVLGDLLRAVLRRDSQPESTLAEEIELTRSYVALEQMRFGDRLRVTFEVADEMRQAMVPCFLMQPLLENAIVHGLRGVRKTGMISVRAVQQDDQLVITVTDNGLGPPAEMRGMRIGVGLGSTCERLAKMYPERHSFSIQKLSEGGAEVRIGVPLRFAGSMDSTGLDEEIPAAHR